MGSTVEYLVCGVVKESEPDVSSVEMQRLFSAMDEQTKEIMLIQMRAELAKTLETDPNYLILGEKEEAADTEFAAEAGVLLSKITDPKMQEMLLKQIRALVAKDNEK